MSINKIQFQELWEMEKRLNMFFKSFWHKYNFIDNLTESVFDNNGVPYTPGSKRPKREALF